MLSSSWWDSGLPGNESGYDSSGRQYSSLQELWESVSADAESQGQLVDKQDWYRAGLQYWKESQSEGYNGVLGGFAYKHDSDIRDSLELLKLLKDLFGLQFERVLDCGAGVGRISQALLTKEFKHVDLLEPAPQLLAKAKEALADSQALCHFYEVGMEDFVFQQRYDAIWIQWVIGHLTDPDLVAFLKKCRQNLSVPSGSGYRFKNLMEAAARTRVLVTGCNKGIGKGILEVLLGKTFNPKLHIIMAVRTPKLGEETKAELLAKHPDAELEVFQLDQGDDASIKAAVERLKGKPIDWLVNNAGTSFSGPRIDHEVISVTMGVNYHGVKKLSEAFLDADLINQNGLIVNVTSMAGKFRDLSTRNPEVYAKLASYQKGGLTVQELDQIVSSFETDMLTPELRPKWRETIYGSSKLFLNIYTYLLSRDTRISSKNIQLYASCPGWCKTDMTKTFGDAPPLSNVEGGDRIAWFLGQFKTIQPELQGQFFENKATLRIDNRFGLGGAIGLKKALSSII